MEEERKNAAGEQAEEITQTVESQRKAEAKARRKNEKKAAKAARKLEKEQARRERTARKQAEKTARTPHLREKALFELWVGGFEKEHQALLREYFDGLNAHLSLARDEVIQFRRDFTAGHRSAAAAGLSTGGSPDPSEPGTAGRLLRMARHAVVPAG